MLTQGFCHACGGSLEFDSEHAGQVVACPLCGQATTLGPAAAVAAPAEPPAEPPPIPAQPPVRSRLGCVYLIVLVLLVAVLAWLADGKDWEDLGGLGRTGYRESVHRIAPVKLTSAAGENLALAYKTTRFSFVLGIYLHDGGYVLAVEGQPDKYYPLPQDLQSFQAEGTLPSPLPAYRIPTYQYVLCFSFWWVVLPLVAVSWVMRRRGSASGADQGAVDT